MKIYPKADERFEGIENLGKTINKYKGVEIQYFPKSKDELVDFGMEPAIKEMIRRYPSIEEITIHPPLEDYELEVQLLKDPNIFLNQLKQVEKLSKKYKIKINLLEHTRLTVSQAKLSIIPVLKKADKIMKNTNVKIVIENIFMMEEQKDCSVIELCEYLNSEHIKVCIDICHLYCQAHIYKKGIEEFLESYLDKEKCKRQVYQVHFSYTKNDDGYIDKKTHGRGHPNEGTLNYDADLLCRYGMADCNWITEVGEDNYLLREDQAKEIEMLTKFKDENKENTKWEKVEE